MSACLDRCAEDVCIHTLVIAKLKLVDVEMQVFLADLMECADDPTFHDGPESFDRIGMNGSADVFPVRMMHHVVRDARIEFPIATMIVRRKQADMMRNCFMNEAVQGRCIGAFNHASHDVSLTLHSADHDELTSSARSSEVSASTFPFVFILGFPAHVGFVYLDIADQFLEFDVAERHADLAAHQPRSFVGAKAHVAADLKRADTLLAGQHQMNDAEPFTQGLIGVLEDRPNQNREPVAIVRALRRLPVPFLVLKLIDLVVFAARTAHTFGSAVLKQIRFAGVLIRELTLEICNRHLMDLQGVLLFFSHGLVSRGVGPICHSERSVSGAG